MTASRPAVLLTCDEANAVIVTALNTVTLTLTSRLPYPTIAAVLYGRPTRRRLTNYEHTALGHFRDELQQVRSAGHGGLIDAQIDGFLSALESDPHFCAA